MALEAFAADCLRDDRARSTAAAKRHAPFREAHHPPPHLAASSTLGSVDA
jgi:hypothetical protein